VCNLASINLSMHMLDGAMDWAKIEESARVAVRQLDNLIDITRSSVAEADFSNQRNRAVGLGVMGFTDVIERMGYSYESEEAYDLIDEIMEHVSYAAIDESANLAQERGSYPNFAGSRWSEGLVPLDTIDLTEADRGVTVEVNRTTRLDWDALRTKVKGGMRNATLMAIAPTASIGLVAGTTPGLDPQFSQIFSRATSSGKFLEINRNLVEALRERGLWESTRESILRKLRDGQLVWQADRKARPSNDERPAGLVARHDLPLLAFALQRTVDGSPAGDVRGDGHRQDDLWQPDAGPSRQDQGRLGGERLYPRGYRSDCFQIPL